MEKIKGNYGGSKENHERRKEKTKINDGAIGEESQ